MTRSEQSMSPSYSCWGSSALVHTLPLVLASLELVSRTCIKFRRNQTYGSCTFGSLVESDLHGQ